MEIQLNLSLLLKHTLELERHQAEELHIRELENLHHRRVLSRHSPVLQHPLILHRLNQQLLPQKRQKKKNMKN